VVDVEQRALRAFEQQAAAGLVCAAYSADETSPTIGRRRGTRAIASSKVFWKSIAWAFR
jgi:hypothetical protein